MDFAYLNAIIKSTTFPPYDPWQSGGFMSYYYFGFVIVGTLIKLIGIVPWVAYNLVVPTLFALTGVGAFAVVYSLVEGDARDTVTAGQGDEGTELNDPLTHSPVHPVTPSPNHPLAVSPLFGGLAATFFVTIIGNFGTVKLLLDQLAARGTVQTQSSLPGMTKLIRALDGVFAWLSGKQPLSFPNDWWFWNPSRVIPEAINEFPFFTFTYADLHAHMIALPLTLLGLAIAVALVRLAGGPFGWQIANSKWQDDPESAIRNPHSTIPGEPTPWRISLPELLPILLMGLVVGALRATNTWDFPTYVLVGLAAIVVLEAMRRLRLPFPTAIDERLAFLFRSAVAVVWRLDHPRGGRQPGLLSVHEVLRNGLRRASALAGEDHDAARLPDRVGLLPRPGLHLFDERVGPSGA